MRASMEPTCMGEEKDPAPYEILKAVGVNYTEAFTQTKGMVKVATKVREVENNKFCTLPFSITVEAEAFGAEVLVDSCFATPRVREKTFKKLENVLDMLEFKCESGIIKQVLDAVEILAGNGENVILNVEGPLTILSMLIDSKTMYKEMIKRPELVIYACDGIISYLCDYVRKAIKNGAKVISYADPFGAYDMVSDNIYIHVCGEVTYRFLKSIEKYIDGCIVHLCAKTSVGFERTGFCEKHKINVDIEDLTYGEVLMEAVKNKDVKFVGHRCMQECQWTMKKPYYWELKLARK